MTLVSATLFIAVPRIFGVPPITRVITGSFRDAVNLDPVMNAVPILPMRLPPTVLQVAQSNGDCDESTKEDKAWKGDRQIIAGNNSKHSAVSKGFASDV